MLKAVGEWPEKMTSAIVKVELREPSTECTKVKTEPTIVGSDAVIEFGAANVFDVFSDLEAELRVQLCRKKHNHLFGKSTKTVANAGIFVKQIVQYVEREHKPIEKEFNLFSKDGTSSGQKLKLKLSYTPIGGWPSNSGLSGDALSEDEAARTIQKAYKKHHSKKGGKGPLKALAVLGLLGGAAAAIATKIQQ